MIKAINGIVSSNTTLFITSGSAQLYVSATIICHHQVVHKFCWIATSCTCSAIWMVWGGLCVGRDVTVYLGGGILVLQEWCVQYSCLIIAYVYNYV
jgi:hypothetical protein